MIKKQTIVSMCLTALLVGIVSSTAGQDVPILKDVFKDHFLIGGAFNRWVVTGRDAGAAAIAEKHLNTATAENIMKWQRINPWPDRYNWEPADDFVAFCEKNKMASIGHCLVWHSQVPRWVFRDESGNALTREALLARMKEHIMTVVGRYKGRVKGWDVVNEALEGDGTLRNNQWLQIIGEGTEDKQYDFIENAFRWAHEADPDAELYYNDYGLETSKAKCDGAVALVKHLKSKGIRIDGVGIQLHGSLTHPSAEGLEYAITSLAAAGVKVMVTELDIRTRTRGYRGADIRRVNRQATRDQNAETAETQKKLADKYAEIFSVLVKHKKDITRVTFWGVYDGASWIGGSPLLFDRNYQPKEAFFSIVKTAKDNLPEKQSNADDRAASFTMPLKWKSTDMLIKPVSDETHNIVSVKDPTIVRYNDKWHIYATAFSNSARTWSMVYLNFKDFSDAPKAKLHYIDVNPNLRGYHCAPNLFYFRPHKKWYLVFQSQHPQYCTTDDLSKPETWTKPQDFFEGKPSGAPRLWIDYWVICDDTHAYLYFTGDNGRVYRSRTRIEDFPKGMSNPEICIEGPRNDVFEGSMTYRIKGTGTYLTLVEAMSPARYYRAWISDSLDGEWKPVDNATTWEKPFAGINNVTFEDGVKPWTRDISHGELIRDGYDETMTIDPDNLQLLYQGRDPEINARYDQLPYRLGLLKLDRSQ